jgi:cephalosporin hydroxylase
VTKKIYTKDEYDEMLKQKAREMSGDRQLGQRALDVLVDADRYNWIQQMTWFGERLLNLPQDMFAMQEIMYATRPKHIVELGVAWGGSLLFYSTLMEMLGGESIIGVDIFIPGDLRDRLSAHGRLSQRLKLVQGSSLNADTVANVRKLVGTSTNNLIVIDSCHTHDHVLEELRLYSPLVGKGSYIVCCDTIIDVMPMNKDRDRPWGPGNNPQSALWQFLGENKRFEIDKEVENKLLFTCHPNGYLRCVRD